MKMKYLFLLGLSALYITGLSSCKEIKRGEYVKGAASIYCDDGFKNVLEEEIDVFEYLYPESSIIPKYVSEQEAVEAIVNDSTDAVILTHELTKDQIKYIRDTHKKVAKTSAIAVDAVALIVNHDNKVNQLSMEEIGKIMKGEITRWSQLDPSEDGDINLVFDNQGSSTVLYMRDKFLGGEKITDNPNVKVYAENNNLEVFDIVKSNPKAIGIISVSWLGDSLENAHKIPAGEKLEAVNDSNFVAARELTTEVKVLAVQNPTEENDFTLTGYKPYQAYIADGAYPLVRTIYMVTTASNSTLMKSFYDFVTSDVGQKIITNTGVVPYKLYPRIINLL